MIKKSIFLKAIAIILCITLLSMSEFFTVQAEESKTIEIYTIQELEKVRDNLSGSYILKRNIDLSSVDSWEPIGTSENPFTGEFDGNGYIISNVNVYSTKPNSIGFFGAVSSGTIKQLHVKGSVKAELRDYNELVFSDVGGIVGSIENSIIEQCSFTGEVTCIVGNRCYARAAGITSGGISSTIRNCYVDAEVYAFSKAVNVMAAGVCCWVDDITVDKCYFTGSVVGETKVGYCYVGGIGASAIGTISNNAVISDNIIGVTGNDEAEAYVNRIGNFSNLVNNLDLNKTASSSKEQETYESLGWDFNATWIMVSGHPQLMSYLKNLDLREKAKLYLDLFDIAYSQGDNANHVTQNIGLTTENPYGLDIRWHSSNRNVIDNDGTVIRPPEDTPVQIIVDVYFEERDSALVGYSKTFDLLVVGTGETPSSDPVNMEYVQFQTLKEDEAVELLEFISAHLEYDEVETQLSDFYNLLTGNLSNQPVYAQKVKAAFIEFVYICINTRTSSNDYKINFAQTALISWLETKGGESALVQQFVNEAVGIVKKALMQSALVANGVELAKLPVNGNCVQNFLDWSIVAINSIGGLVAAKDQAEIKYLASYLKNRDSEYLDIALSVAASGIMGVDGAEKREKLDRWGETIYQIEKSLDSSAVVTYTAQCPVTLEVYNSSGKLVAFLDNDKEGTLFNPYGIFYVIEEPGTSNFIKIAKLYTDDCYVKIKGTDTGEMNLAVEKAKEDGNQQNFQARLPVSDTTEITVLSGDSAPRITIHSTQDDSFDQAVQIGEVEQKRYSVSTTVTDGGFILGGEPVYAGSEIFLTAYPEDGYVFSGWYENDCLIGSAPQLSLVVNANRNLCAVFQCPVTGVTLNHTELSLELGDKTKLLPTVTPKNATNQSIRWETSDPSVASVDEEGNVTAVAPGTAIITATTEDGGYTASCTVTVTAPTLTLTLDGQAVEGDVAYVKLPSVLMMYKNHSATLGFAFDQEVEVASVNWSYASWSVDSPEANIESPTSAETVVRPNGKGIGARSTWVTLTVTDVDGNTYQKTVKVRFYKWDWQRK